jgi:hypothetical protein
MGRIVGTFAVAGLLAIGLNAQSGTAPTLDIVGIKLGMTTREAAAALRADNPRLMLRPTTRTLEGFAQPLLFSIVGQETTTSGPDSTITRAGEDVELLFTTPPGPEVVWGVKRIYTFATKEMPDLQITLDALRKKYGQETVPASPDGRDMTKNMVWVYDAEGKPMGPGGAPLNVLCAPRFMAHFGNGDVQTMNEIQSGQLGPAQCQSIILINANVQGSRLDQSNPQLVVRSLIVNISDGSRHRASTEATRATALAASKARENKDTEEIKSRAAPKL